LRWYLKDQIVRIHNPYYHVTNFQTEPYPCMQICSVVII
jgi:hypothetical protein